MYYVSMSLLLFRRTYSRLYSRLSSALDFPTSASLRTFLGEACHDLQAAPLMPGLERCVKSAIVSSKQIIKPKITTISYSSPSTTISPTHLIHGTIILRTPLMK